MSVLLLGKRGVRPAVGLATRGRIAQSAPLKPEEEGVRWYQAVFACMRWRAAHTEFAPERDAQIMASTGHVRTARVNVMRASGGGTSTTMSLAVVWRLSTEVR